MSPSPPYAPPLTADHLYGIGAQLKQHGKRCELVSGELRIMSPAGGQHGALASDIGAMLASHARALGLGRCFGAETGFVIQRDPDSVRAPDVAFVAQDRIDAIGIPERFFPETPTLAVEIISPSETESQVHAKAQMWIESGCEMVWLVWPSSRTVTVYRSLEDVRELATDQTLEGGDVLPGFSVPVATLFESLP
ncbi:MAG: Uma2 family endonuclease [Planctomycetota bacterium]